MITWGTRHAAVRLPALPFGQLASAPRLLRMQDSVRPIVRRIAGRRNRLLARALWERDGGLCGRCYLEIDPTLHGYLPGALTIGHIVPRILGGTNDPSNLRPEHRRCNLAAGASLDLEPPRARIVTP